MIVFSLRRSGVSFTTGHYIQVFGQVRVQRGEFPPSICASAASIVRNGSQLLRLAALRTADVTTLGTRRKGPPGLLDRCRQK